MQQLDFIINTFSTCFGHHYAHLQENKTCVTARDVLRCNKRGKMGRLYLHITTDQENYQLIQTLHTTAQKRHYS